MGASVKSSLPEIVRAETLRPGLATIVVSFPATTYTRARVIRSKVLMVQPNQQGGVQVCFASGDVLTLSARTMVGVIQAPRRSTRRAS